VLKNRNYALPNFGDIALCSCFHFKLNLTLFHKSAKSKSSVYLCRGIWRWWMWSGGGLGGGGVGGGGSGVGDVGGGDGGWCC